MVEFNGKFSKGWDFGKQCMQSKRVLTQMDYNLYVGVLCIQHRYFANLIALMVRIELLRSISSKLHGALRMMALYHFLQPSSMYFVIVNFMIKRLSTVANAADMSLVNYGEHGIFPLSCHKGLLQYRCFKLPNIKTMLFIYKVMFF